MSTAAASFLFIAEGNQPKPETTHEATDIHDHRPISPAELVASQE